MIFFIFHVVHPKLQVVQQGQILQAIQDRRETFAQRHLHMQAAISLPQEREDLVFLLQPRGFLLYAFFQYRITLGEFI